MNSGDFTKLEQAITLVQHGQKAAAYSQFKALLPANQHDVKLLLWIAYTTPSPEEAEFALMKAALVEPSNMDIARAFEWLDKRPAAPMAAQTLAEQPVTITVPARNTGAPAGASQTALLERVEVAEQPAEPEPKETAINWESYYPHLNPLVPVPWWATPIEQPEPAPPAPALPPAPVVSESLAPEQKSKKEKKSFKFFF